jgi:phosphoribosylformylglycinamidine synthase
MLSESQERMLLVVKPKAVERVSKIAKKWELEASCVGEVTQDGNFEVCENGKTVYKIPLDALVKKAPVFSRPEKEPEYLRRTRGINIGKIPVPKDPVEAFLKVLLSPNILSKEWVWRQYDHTVMTNTTVLPGSDAAVVRVKDGVKGLALSTDCNPVWCYLDPYNGTKMAVFESARNVTCVGARPMAITDCLNFGSPENPEVMWQFARCIDGMSSALDILGIPAVSGNVSFYNENEGIPILPTPTIGMVGVVDDVNRVCDITFKEAGDTIILIGRDRMEIGGSEYLMSYHNILGGIPPSCHPSDEIKTARVIRGLISKGLLKSCHDISEGGILVSILECLAYSEDLGAWVKIPIGERWDFSLFSESAPRYIVTTSEVDEVMKVCKADGIDAMVIGNVTDSGSLHISGLFEVKLPDIVSKWSEGMVEFF